VVLPVRPERGKARAGRVFNDYIGDCGLMLGSQMDGLADWRTATGGPPLCEPAR
jgi:hypothetical protein